eukprot:6299838-Alexandrium_andersonii.AAC.1
MPKPRSRQCGCQRTVPSNEEKAQRMSSGKGPGNIARGSLHLCLSPAWVEKDGKRRWLANETAEPGETAGKQP